MERLVACRNAAEAHPSAMTMGTCVVVSEIEISPRDAIARRNTVTTRSEILTPKNADDGVGVDSEKTSRARRNTTTIAKASVMPRETVSDDAVDAAIEGRMRTTQVMSHAPIATIEPSASTPRAREPSREAITTDRAIAMHSRALKKSISEAN
jgi:hypothetical protein